MPPLPTGSLTSMLEAEGEGPRGSGRLELDARVGSIEERRRAQAQMLRHTHTS